MRSFFLGFLLLFPCNLFASEEDNNAPNSSFADLGDDISTPEPEETNGGNIPEWSLPKKTVRVCGVSFLVSLALFGVCAHAMNSVSSSCTASCTLEICAVCIVSVGWATKICHVAATKISSAAQACIKTSQEHILRGDLL